MRQSPPALLLLLLVAVARLPLPAQAQDSYDEQCNLIVQHARQAAQAQNAGEAAVAQQHVAASFSPLKERRCCWLLSVTVGGRGSGVHSCVLAAEACGAPVEKRKREQSVGKEGPQHNGATDHRAVLWRVSPRQWPPGRACGCKAQQQQRIACTCRRRVRSSACGGKASAE